MSLLKHAQPVERIHRPSVDEFVSRFVLPGRPVIATGTMDDWAALERWTPDYLRDTIGDLELPAYFDEDGIFRPDPVHGYTRRYRPTRIRTGLEQMFERPDSRAKYYFAQLSVREDLAAIAGDVRVPELGRAFGPFQDSYAWIGSAGQRTQLHYDGNPSLQAQIIGRKRFVLFAPDDLRNLYPWSFTTHWHSAHASRVDLEQVDARSFPRVSAATPFVAEIGPGDLLFLPTAWWHDVTSLASGISIAYWFRRRFRENFSRSMLRMGASILLSQLRSGRAEVHDVV